MICDEAATTNSRCAVADASAAGRWTGRRIAERKWDDRICADGCSRGVLFGGVVSAGLVEASGMARYLSEEACPLTALASPFARRDRRWNTYVDAMEALTSPRATAWMRCS